MNNNGYEAETNGSAGEPMQPQENGSKEKHHWSVQPRGLMTFFIVSGILLSLVELAIRITDLGFTTSHLEMMSTSPLLYLALYVIDLIFPVLTSILIYLYVRRQQKRQGFEGIATWRVGTALWLGLALLVGYAVLLTAYKLTPYLHTDPIPEILYSIIIMTAEMFIGSIVSGLAAVSISLYFPVLERKSGLMKASLAACAIFAALSIVGSVTSRAANSIFLPQLMGQTSFWNYLLQPVPASFFGSIAYTALGIALFLVAKRRIPGTWALLSAAIGLLGLLQEWLPKLLPDNVPKTYWLIQLEIHLPVYLLVFAISIGMIAAFGHWKTPQAFRESMKALAAKTKYTQEDVE